MDIGGYEIYKRIGINEVYIAKGAPIGNSLGGRFYTTLIKKQYLRMGSLMYEPINLAYFYSFCSLISCFSTWTKDKLKRVFYILVSSIGLILTFGKGGYLIAISALLALLTHKILRNLKKTKSISEKKVYKLTFIVIAIFLSAFSLYYYHNIGAAVNTHFWAIERTWKNILKHPYGHGLGTGGNAATTFNDTSKKTWLETGGESALMSFTYQIGIQGSFCLIMCMLSFVNFNNKKLKNIEIVFKYIPLILIGLSIMQDNTFTPQCITPFMLALGYFYNNSAYTYQNKSKQNVVENAFN